MVVTRMSEVSSSKQTHTNRVTETAVCVAIHQGPSPEAEHMLAPCPGPRRLRNLMLNVFLFAFRCWKCKPGPRTCLTSVYHLGSSPALGFLEIVM